MNFEDLLELIATFKMIGKMADKMAVGDEDTFEIPGAEDMAALLIRGKKGARFRITGLQVEREK